MKILVVDDSSTMRRIIVNTLRRIGFEQMEEAENGEVAFAKYSASTFDVVITDWNMPVMNGLDLVKKIREKNRDIPIVMVTTEGGKAEVIVALKAGVNNYIIKPFTPQVLESKIKEILS